MDPIYIDAFDYIQELTDDLKSIANKPEISHQEHNELQILQNELFQACKSHKSFLNARNLLSTQRDD